MLLFRQKLSILAEEVLVRSQVHTLTLASNHERISNGQQSKVLSVVNILLEVNNRLVCKIGPRRVNSGHNVANGGLEITLFAGRKSNLDENSILTPLRVLVQKQLIRQQLLANTTNVVKLITSDNEPLALVAILHNLQPLGNLWRIKMFTKTDRVNTNSQMNNINKSVLKLETIRCSFGVQNATAGLEEMTSVLVNLETDEVSTEHTLQKLLSDSQASENLG